MDALARWSDEQLVAVFGDPGFDAHTQELMCRFGEEVRSRVKRRVTDPQGAGEAEADTWSRVLTGKNTFVSGAAGSARVWVNSIADRAAIDWLRRRARARLLTGLEDGLTDRPATDPGPEDCLAEREEDECVRRAGLRLSAEDQAVLVLARPGPSAAGIGLGLLTQQQVAWLVGCSGPSAVHQRLRGILERLQKLVLT